MKRHSDDEIAFKLRQADDLYARGQSQVQICKHLAISIMTFHRWRKLTRTEKAGPASDGSFNLDLHNTILDTTIPAPEHNAFVQELVEENNRLKKIVANLLLEKMKLEEADEANIVRLVREPQRTVPR